jgi:hypothetical protein
MGRPRVVFDEQLEKKREHSRAYYHAHRDQQSARAKRWARAHRQELAAYKRRSRAENPGKDAAYQRDYHARTGNHLRRMYGLTREGYATLLAEQDGRCAICREVMLVPQVDHIHGTKIVRGLLCKKCNMAIGLLQDSSNIVQSALTYLSLDRSCYAHH